MCVTLIEKDACVLAGREGVLVFLHATTAGPDASRGVASGCCAAL